MAPEDDCPAWGEHPDHASNAHGSGGRSGRTGEPMKRYVVGVAIQRDFFRFNVAADSPAEAEAEAVRLAERQAFAKVEDVREVG